MIGLIRGFARNALTLMGTTIFAVVVFDVCVFFFAPRSVVGMLPGYKVPADPAITAMGGLSFYPNGYFVSHMERGFDIGPSRRARHFVPEYGAYDIWSNELGCFDAPIEASAAIEELVYLAGDSYTWGFAPYEAKFGTLLEPLIHRPVLSCGVTHTGQRHQFSKFKEIVHQLGRFPPVVIVNYVFNDMANDYAYPHSTVIEGWQIDNVKLGERNELVRIPDEVLTDRIHLQEMARSARSRADDLKDLARRYSATLQIVNRAWSLISAREPAPSSTTDMRDLYLLYDQAAYPYREVFAQPNKDVLLEWRADSELNGYRLIVCLIAPKASVSDPEYYAGLKGFLGDNEIEFHDFADSRYVNAEDDPAGAFYWQFDGHFNLEGNSAYAAFLASVL